MRICHITNFWPTTSGLTQYTNNLIAGMRATRGEQHIVIGEGATEAAETKAYRVIPCWSRDEDYVDNIVRAVLAAKGDIALFQYANDLFGHDDRIVRTVAALGKAGVKTAVFCHSVYPSHWRTQFKPEKTCKAFDLALAKHSDCLVLHSETMRRELMRRGVNEKQIAVIPHGTVEMPHVGVGAAREKLGLPADAKVIMFFGFIWLGKGLDFFLDVFADIAKQVPDAHLYIGGYTRHKKIYTRAYMAYLRARQWQLGIAKRTSSWGDYVPEEMVPTLFAAADIVGLPYRQDYASVSGVFHEAIGANRLVFGSDIAKFEELAQVSKTLVAPPKDRRAWVNGIVRLLEDKNHASKMKAKLTKFAKETSWEAVGKQHLKLCDRLLAS